MKLLLRVVLALVAICGVPIQAKMKLVKLAKVESGGLLLGYAQGGNMNLGGSSWEEIYQLVEQILDQIDELSEKLEEI